MGPELIIVAILFWSWLPATVTAAVLFGLWSRKSARPYVTGIFTLAVLFSLVAGIATFTSEKMFTEPQYWVSTLLLFFFVGALVAGVGAVIVWFVLRIAKQFQTNDSKSDRAVFEEGFNSVRHSIPPENELKPMSYAQLAVLLASHTKGSPAHSVISREMVRKAHAEDTKAHRVKISFWQHPVIKTVLFITGVVTAAFIIFVFDLK